MAIKIDLRLVTDWRAEYRVLLADWQNQSFELWNSPLTKQQLQTMWAQMAGGTSNIEIINQLSVPVGIRQPWANPGTNDNALNIKTLTDANTYLQINSYELVNPPIATGVTIPWVMYWIDENNYWAASEYASTNIVLVKNGVIYQGHNQIGCYGLRQQFKTTSSSESTARLGIMGKTADDIIFSLVIGSNRTNSGLNFSNDTFSAAFLELYRGSPPADDPYDNQGGSTTPGGGGGIGVDNIINDDIDFPTPVAASASNANFISIWTPTLDQVQNLASWMWTTDPLKWGFWQKLLQNPLDLIFSLSIMPIPIHHTDDPSTPSEEDLVATKDSLSLGWQDTGIEMDWVTEQYVTLDMGTIDIEEIWGAFLDYEPYTKIDIFLPYIGTKQLDTNDCMPRTISLRYIIDLATGTCVALIKCDNSVYYHFSGNCASQIPITVNQCQEIVRGLMTMAVGAASFAIGGAVGAGAHASKAAIAKGAAMQAGGAAMVGSGADNAAKGVNVSRSGVIGCAAGLMDIQTPYLIISRPRQAVPENQSTYTGYPSFMTKQIGELEGYTEIQIIHLEHMTCTDEEYEEINALLLEGVII